MPKVKRGGTKRGGSARAGVTFAPGLDNVLTEEDKKEFMRQVETATAIFGFDNAVDQIVKSIDADASSGVYASYTRGSGEIHLNTWYYDGNYERIERMYNRDVDNGFHPKGTNWRSIIAHETGHAIEDKIADAYIKNENMPFDEAWEFKYGRRGTNEIVNKAVRNVKKSGVYGKDASAHSIKKSLSGYALKNQSETFAEAIADYSQNGSRSNPLTLEIIKLTKEVLGR